MKLPWRPAANNLRIGAAGVILVALGVLFGRGDVAAFGAPLILAAFIADKGKPTANTVLHFDEAQSAQRPGELSAELTVEPAPEAETVQVRIYAPGHRSSTVILAAKEPRTLEMQLDSVKTGPNQTFEVFARGYGILSGYAEDTWSISADQTLVLPRAAKLGRVLVPTRLRGLTGPRRSRRLGDGQELRDVHPMAPGDRARRIDWRSTARRSPALDELYVRRTFASAEAGAVLVLDSRDEVGPDLHTWRGSEPIRFDEATSLDLARHAAASIATALVDAGDRVGLEDLARTRRPLAPAMGKRHLRRILHALALSSPIGDATRRLRAPQLPNDVLVYLFTTLLDEDPVDLVKEWIGQGVPVVVIDTLPGVLPVTDLPTKIAWRVTSMERTDRRSELESLGVTVLRWADQMTATRKLEEAVRAAARHQVAGR